LPLLPGALLSRWMSEQWAMRKVVFIRAGRSCLTARSAQG
jgi:hypothetical protein